MRALIVGCGYVGLPLGVELVKQGHEVFGLRRSAGQIQSMIDGGLKPLTADITKPDELANLPAPFDWVVNTVSSNKGGVSEYQEVYLSGTRNLVEWLAPMPPKKFVYTSSTGVYGQSDASLVKETSPTDPVSPTSKVLVETEKVLLEAFRTKQFPAVILRVAGIYGPDRTHFLGEFIKDRARMPAKGERIMNMIHRDDLVSVIISALKNGRAGEVYNVVDDEPVAQIQFYRWLAEALGKELPPFSGEEPERKRVATSKKVSNRKLKMELGVQLKYPTFRQGYTAEMIRLDRAGLLEAKPGSE